jgi:alanine racemase
VDLSGIADLFGYDLPVDENHPMGYNLTLSYLLTDSRTVVFPDESLFFALKSDRNNGHRYIAELYRKGVRAFVVSEDQDSEMYPGAFFIRVENTLLALQQLAAYHRTQFQLPVVGITGSNGKTIVKEWLSQLLSPDFQIVRSPRSYNSQLGVALSVWLLRPDTQLGIFEAGISMPGEMVTLEPMIRPDTGILTTIGGAHQENFESLEAKIREKLVLFKSCSTLIFNTDNELVRQQINESMLKGRLVSWGWAEDAEVRIMELTTGDTALVRLLFNSTFYSFRIPFADQASVENALHCVVYMLLNCYDESTINNRLSQLEKVAMRLEVKEGVNNCLVINDSYNSDVDALKIALDFLNQQASSKKLGKTLVLSDIYQSGYTTDVLYEKVATLVRACKVQKLIAVGPDLMRSKSLFSDLEASFFFRTEELFHSELLDGFRNEAILLKGSRAFHFEALSARLEKIAHETILEVNLNHLVSNLNYFRSHLNPGTKVMCMVKAFAYGSGSVEVARVLQHHQVDYLAVAVADEGAELRQAGIHLPIVVMNPEKSVFDLVFENQLEPEIYSFRLLKSFIAAAAKRGIQSYPIHLKLDSGMHRLGFDPNELDSLIQLLGKHSEVMVKSVFSHLAGADSPSLDHFTHHQAQIFQFCARRIQEAFYYPIMRHLLNSAGIERFSAYQMEMVRLGIGHYGISALPELKLPQVCTLKTIILQLKMVAAGGTVGYNRSGQVNVPTRIAVLPVGYADGFDRKLSNGVGEVLIKGQRAPVIGNVSMDLTTVDVTGLDVEEGDQVEVFGDGITISEIAQKIETIPYEILTGISRRVKRVYFQE